MTDSIWNTEEEGVIYILAEEFAVKYYSELKSHASF